MTDDEPPGAMAGPRSAPTETDERSGRARSALARFNKFDWLKALLSDTSLPDTAFRIGVAICTTFTWNNGVGWAFDLDDLAEAIGHRLSQNTVKAAVQQLVSRGYVAETYRSEGGRGRRWRRSFDLKPARPAVRVIEETRTHTDAGIEVTRTHERAGYGQNPHVSTTKPARLDDKTRTFARTKKHPEQHKEPSEGITSGITSGGRACAGEASPTPEPSGPSNAHPNTQSGVETDRAAATAVPPMRPGRRYTIAPPTPDELARAADLPRPPNHWPKSFPEPEPSRFCDKHPGGTSDKCPRCGDARNAHGAWDGRRRTFNAELAAAKRKWVDACDACDDEHGDLLGPDGEVLDTVVRCPHVRLWAAYWIGRRVIAMWAAA